MDELRLSILGECAIRVGESELTPASSHLFALLLFLTFERGRAHARADLQQLLFTNAEDVRNASHNLRQLLYRLRRAGVPLDLTVTAVSLGNVSVMEPLSALRTLPSQERARLSLKSLEILPGYSPRLPRSFMNWLDGVRDRVQEDIRRLLLSDLRASRDKQEWHSASQFGALMRELDPLNEEATSAHAEALAMVGRRNDALDVLDTFIRQSEDDTALVAPARRLRSRIAKMPAPRREGTLWGREQSLAMMDAEWRQIDEGGARLTVIVGPAGMGKSRVAEAFANRVAMRRGHVIRYRCDADSRYTPLALFSHVLPELQSLPGSLGASPNTRLALARLRPSKDASTPDSMDATSVEMRRAELHNALIDLLDAVSAEQRILLLVDDAHLLDDASIAIIRTLSVAPNDARIHFVACSRPTQANATPFGKGARVAFHLLSPLSEEESRQLVLECSPRDFIVNEHVDWCLREAAGSPFYLRALAHQVPMRLGEVPFDIRALAATLYQSLGSSCKTVLEACLTLGRFATIRRVIAVSGLEHSVLLNCLRELEEHDLVHMEGAALQGPHALLHDALRALVPGAVKAFVSHRIATVLETECVQDQFSADLAWASAQNWIASGDPDAAAHLIRRCAAHAAALGEPATAADLITRIADACTRSSLRATLLDDVIGYADAGGLHSQVAISTRQRLQLARELGEDAATIKQLEFRRVEAELLDGGSLDAARAELERIVLCSSAEIALRAKAAARLIVMADGDLSRANAERIYSVLEDFRPRDAASDTAFLRAELAYHTVFGNEEYAKSLAYRVLEMFPRPELSEAVYRVRSYAAFSLFRMCCFKDAIPSLVDTYEFMHSRSEFSRAVHSATILAEIFHWLGDIDSCAQWAQKGKSSAMKNSRFQLAYSSGLLSIEAHLAAHQGRYEDAARLIAEVPQGMSLLTTARYEATNLAQRISLLQQCGEDVSESDVRRLSELYLRGRTLGAQDPVVAALWSSMVLSGAEQPASRLLNDYLNIYRREQQPVTWVITHATAADEAWTEYSSSRRIRAS